jgi:serpin B
MRQTARFHYAECELCQVLELPYAGDALSMAVLLPKERDGLADLEEALSPEALAGWLGRPARRKVEVTLPRFRLTQQFRLDGVLQKMGMAEVFCPGTADLSGMNGRRDLFVSAVVHKAFVDVNEEGTEAAAATGVVVGLTAAPKPPPEFRADHPFVLLIRHRPSGSILFMGRVRNPVAGQ